ncbi:TetR/AcrR family transcriptional regulator [Saccharospirillum mangrovi]|uniref:TetR/AcrR family transcriptional regulator n=1 Tax=Saccharospirillum mangrovi TaxID=2161747 RepID=UPI000D3AB61C|nr:TetR/AcrR family transcriptional regulator [Saccharospirillum mangrovi]
MTATDTSAAPESARERKRRETRRRIAETGLKLFIVNGYDGTTLDAIAEAAGISRRTFFYYFKSKEEVLLAWQGSGFEEALAPAIAASSPTGDPLQTVQQCLTELSGRYETPESLIVDQLLRSTETLRLRKEALFMQMEATLFEALCQVWPEPEQKPQLQMVAIVGMGAFRLAMEAWRQAGGAKPLSAYITQGFDAFKTLQQKPA